MMLQGVAEPSRWLGETWGFWTQNLILSISAIAAVWVIRASKTQEKRRATIDVVMYQKRDTALTAAREVLLRMHDAREINLAKHLDEPGSSEYKAILVVLNSYEFIACGIRESAFDEDTYKRLRYSNVPRDWDILCGFVLEFRRAKNLGGLFQEYEWLVKRWRKNPLKTDR